MTRKKRKRRPACSFDLVRQAPPSNGSVRQSDTTWPAVPVTHSGGDTTPANLDVKPEESAF